MAKSRLVGSYPVIGIRPTIDGRRGALDVRGSLEEQTMNMAKSAAKLFEENLRYSNGEPVKVVIADTTIGRVGESAACADKFRREGVDITVTVTPCWCYGAETMDMDPQTIKAVWGFNGTERPGAVYLASVLATHAQKGLPAFGIYGHDVQEADDTSIPEDVKEKLLRFGRAAVAAASMRGKSYLQIGSVTMGIGGSIIDSDFIESYLGMRVESVDEVTVIDNNETIINLFNKNIYPFFNHKNKFNIIKADAYSFLKSKDIQKYDYLFIDLYHDENDGLPFYLNMKKEIPSSLNYDFWIENSFIVYIRRIMIALIEECLDGSKDSDYLNPKSIEDKLFSGIYDLTKDVELKDSDSLLEFLSDDNIRNIAKKWSLAL